MVGVEIFLVASGEQAWARTEGSHRRFLGSFVLTFQKRGSTGCSLLRRWLEWCYSLMVCASLIGATCLFGQIQLSVGFWDSAPLGALVIGYCMLSQLFPVTVPPSGTAPTPGPILERSDSFLWQCLLSCWHFPSRLFPPPCVGPPAGLSLIVSPGLLFPTELVVVKECPLLEKRVDPRGDFENRWTWFLGCQETSSSTAS